MNTNLQNLIDDFCNYWESQWRDQLDHIYEYQVNTNGYVTFFVTSVESQWTMIWYIPADYNPNYVARNVNDDNEEYDDKYDWFGGNPKDYDYVYGVMTNEMYQFVILDTMDRGSREW